MDNYTLFNELLHAETEDAVEAILSKVGYLSEDESLWRPLGFENNFSAIGNQQSDPTAALVEKIINGIDAVLMAQCFARGIDPEGAQAPQTMTEAVSQFFNVRDGRINNLDTKQQQELANNIHLVVVGSKTNPNYLIIDRGEGQTPAKFPDTLVSLQRSNKMRIPFVQGRFNSGGTGILQFCGDKNYQLMVSRRHPSGPVDPSDDTADLWGFTLVRRMLPAGGRRSSMYVFLAPHGQVPSFPADAVKVLPGKSKSNQPAPPYALELPYGTCVKLYNYRWKAKSTITTEGRYELERFLHSPCLPFRVTETRDYTANYYSATVSGGWTSAVAEREDGESTKLEEGFPASAELTIEKIGRLPYQIAVFKEGTKKRHVPHGVFFVVNGQVHGALPSDFVTRRLKFDYLKDALLVSVDCTAMNERVREDFFMASRDRVRHNEVYAEIEQRLADELKPHPGLQEINQRRRKQEMEKHLNEETPLSAFQSLLNGDPTLSSLFAAGDRLVTSTGPADQPPFMGRRFPAYFRLAREPRGGLVKLCPINRTCRVEFETDAVNDYFSRGDSPGEIQFDPPNLCEHSRLWNGHFETRFRVPWDAQPGDSVQVTVTVTDVERETKGRPFVATFTLKAEPAATDEPQPRSGPPATPRGTDTNGTRRRTTLALPKIREVRKEQWANESPPFDQYKALRVKNDGQGGYDYIINIDNTFLLTELARAKVENKPQIKSWFTYGLVLSAVGMIKHNERRQVVQPAEHNGGDYTGEEQDGVSLELVSHYCNGMAQVIVPIIRSLSRSQGDS